MRVRCSVLSVAAVLITAAGCASQPFPASPVPAHLTDREAAYLGTSYLDERGLPPRTITAIEPTETGYLFHYATLFNPPSGPPSQVRLLNINNNGTIREVWFPNED